MTSGSPAWRVVVLGGGQVESTVSHGYLSLPRARGRFHFSVWPTWGKEWDWRGCVLFARLGEFCDGQYNRLY